MSLATDLNTGGVCDAMAARFARADEARRAELERLIQAGKGDKEPPRARLQVVAREETPMPRKVKPQPKGPCTECGSPTCHKRTCSKRPGGPVRPAEKVRAVGRPRKTAPAKGPRVVQVTSDAIVAAADLSIEQLVEVIRACQDELEARQEALRAQLDAVAKAIGSAA